MSDHEDSGEVDVDTTPTAEDVDIKKCDMDTDVTPSDETDGAVEPNGDLDPKVEGAVGLDPPEDQDDLDKILDEENENVFEDNASLEVNLGDGSSRRTSDVSSLSFQNIVLDDPEVAQEEQEFEMSRKDSEESTDSLQNEFLSEGHNYLGFDEEFEIAHLKPPDDADVDLSICKDKVMKVENDNVDCDSKSDSPSDYELIREGDNFECTLETFCVELKSVKSEHARTEMEAQDEMEADQNNHGNTVVADRINENMDGTHRNRNSLEIRNNIPNIKEVKQYGESSAENARYFAQGNLPRIRKKSPGLAHRLEEGLSPDGSREPSVCSDTSRDYSDSGMPRVYTGHRGSHNENNAIDREANYPIDGNRANGLNACSSPAELHSNYSESTGSIHDGNDGSTGSLGHDHHRKSLDVENEYDYIKFARIHQGDSYVGMRLAYSSSNDSLNCKRHSWGGVKSDDGSVGDSSRENSPQKIIRKTSENGSLLPMDCDGVLDLNDENLTEIPLNGDVATNMEENRKITLSPETTECDSAEVESVISEGKDSLGMPNVEDGLSSSQCSDSEDGPHDHDLPTPAEILRQRQRAEIEAGFTNSVVHGIANINEMIEERLTSMPSHMHHHQGSSQMTDEFSRDALDLTMQDIKLAIQKSKSMTLKSPYKDNPETRPKPEAEEPVWVMRYVVTTFF
jgi:hypothetical protein